MKDASPETALRLAQAEMVAKGMDPASVLEGSQMPNLPEPKFDKAMLSAEVVEYLDAVEAMAKANAPATSAHVDSEAEEFEKALASMPEPVRKSFRAQQREAAEAKAMAKSLVDTAENAKYLAMAKSMSGLPGVDPAEFAPVLRKAADADPDAFAVIAKTLGDTVAYLRESDMLTKELGSSADGQGGAADILAAKATELQKADATLTAEQAMTKAAQLNPGLYARHLKEGD